MEAVIIVCISVAAGFIVGFYLGHQRGELAALEEFTEKLESIIKTLRETREIWDPKGEFSDLVKDVPPKNPFDSTQVDSTQYPCRG